MKLAILISIFLVLIAGCTTVQEANNGQQQETNQGTEPDTQAETGTSISGTTELMLSEQDLGELGLANNLNEEDLEILGMPEGTNCRTEDDYSNTVDASLGQYTLCTYIANSLNGTEVIIELQKFADYEALNGSYQYNTMHLFGAKGLLEENTLGDMSRLRVNSEDDYGAEFNTPGMYYYHLWVAKDLFLVHITSSGTMPADEQIVDIGEKILSKFK